MSQLSLFGAGGRDVRLADLDALLAGPGRLVHKGQAVRLSIPLVDDAAWRSRALAISLAQAGLICETVESERGPVVRTAFTPLLAPLAARWERGAAQTPPDTLHLSGPGLRLWCIASGTSTPDGFSLGLGAGSDEAWDVVGQALAGLGLAPTIVRARSSSPTFRITGRRRLVRLIELVGEPPEGSDAANWPSGVQHSP